MASPLGSGGGRHCMISDLQSWRHWDAGQNLWLGGELDSHLWFKGQTKSRSRGQIWGYRRACGLLWPYHKLLWSEIGSIMPGFTLLYGQDWFERLRDQARTSLDEWRPSLQAVLLDSGWLRPVAGVETRQPRESCTLGQQHLQQKCESFMCWAWIEV